jgi:hypothetical protein
MNIKGLSRKSWFVVIEKLHWTQGEAAGGMNNGEAIPHACGV